MKHNDSHLTDERLLLDIEGELPSRDRTPVREHLSACWKCRTRRRELEQAIADFIEARRDGFEAELPRPEGPRALLKARLDQLSESGQPNLWRSLTAAAAVACVLALGLLVARLPFSRHAEAEIRSIPDSRLTPGATLLVGRPAVCAQPETNNKPVPANLRQKVFDEYGISGADPHAYEVDYLVTPALGGADDIRNLWPHSYSATVWNARVKDALEDRLREMVCDGHLDLEEAQREIASDWIAAYKKYFHTDKPLAEHCGQCMR